MNISRNEQRALHVLALGGRILYERGDGPKITAITCVTRDGMALADCDLTVFNRSRLLRPVRLSGLSRAGRDRLPPEVVQALPFDGIEPRGELIHHPAFGLDQQA